MKTILLKIVPLLLCLFTLSASAQYLCIPGARYSDEVFSTVTTTSNITYGSAKSYSGATTTLKLDIYEPSGDTATKRPLIIWGHGGSFVSGTKTDVDVATLATRFAKRGYVCVSYDYRLGFFPFDQANASKAVYRATQDAKAAVRFMRKDAATANTYKIDPSYIYLGGSSAGAFIALHYAYLDQQAEVPSYIDTAGLGIIEGTSGNAGYNSEVNAIINLCGALGDISWMHVGDEPVCSMHGTVDAVVPYATDTIFVGGFPIMVVDGSHTIDSMADVLGLDHEFHTWIGADHVPYASNTTYMDSTVEFIRDFLCAQNLKASATGLAENKNKNDFIKIYPTVSSGEIKIENNTGAKISLVMADITGRIIKKLSTYEKTISVFKENISPGIYLLSISGTSFRKTEKIVFY